jgi:hypothetical protein
MMRFFQQTETGTGNYTEERKQWLLDFDVNCRINPVNRKVRVIVAI